MFMGQKIWYCQDDSAPQIDLRRQCSPYQNPSQFPFLLGKGWQVDPKIDMEMQGI